MLIKSDVYIQKKNLQHFNRIIAFYVNISVKRLSEFYLDKCKIQNNTKTI